MSICTSHHIFCINSQWITDLNMKDLLSLLKALLFLSSITLSHFPIKTTLNPRELEILQLNCHLSGMIFLLKIISFNKTEEKRPSCSASKKNSNSTSSPQGLTCPSWRRRTVSLRLQSAAVILEY